MTMILLPQKQTVKDDFIDFQFWKSLMSWLYVVYGMLHHLIMYM